MKFTTVSHLTSCLQGLSHHSLFQTLLPFLWLSAIPLYIDIPDLVPVLSGGRSLHPQIWPLWINQCHRTSKRSGTVGCFDRKLTSLDMFDQGGLVIWQPSLYGFLLDRPETKNDVWCWERGATDTGMSCTVEGRELSPGVGSAKLSGWHQGVSSSQSTLCCLKGIAFSITLQPMVVGKRP